MAQNLNCQHLAVKMVKNWDGNNVFKCSHCGETIPLTGLIKKDKTNE